MNPIMIAAVDRKNGIGKLGMLPWRIPEDMRFFRQQTMNSCVIMGRTTFESIGGSLPGRENIVVSRRGELGARVNRVETIEHALERAIGSGRERIFVIGGEQIYRAALPYCNTVMLTRVPLECKCDRFFPELDLAPGPDGWKRLSTRREHADSLDASLEFTIYQRQQPVDIEPFAHYSVKPFQLPRRCEGASVV